MGLLGLLTLSRFQWSDGVLRVIARFEGVCGSHWDGGSCLIVEESENFYGFLIKIWNGNYNSPENMR